MASYTISHVRLVDSPTGTHKHIEKIKLTNGTILTRAEVIAKIRNGDTFQTSASPPGSVYVHPCPHCAASDYITTHPDSTATNNLLHLPAF